MPNENEATAIQPAKKKRSVLGCLLSLFAGALLFIILLVGLVIWLAGSDFTLRQASDYVQKKSGGKLTFAGNDTNFFAGRLHWKGVELTNPSRFTDKGFVKIDELKGDVALGSVIKTGLGMDDTIRVNEVIVNIGALSLVGADDWMKDNNALEFQKAFAPAPATTAQPEQPKTEQPKTEQPAPRQQPAPEGPKKHVRIDRLVIKLGKVRVLKHAITPNEQPIVVTEKDVNFDWELTDVSDENLLEKLRPLAIRDFSRLGGVFSDVALTLGTAMINDKIKDVTGQANEAVKNATDKASKAVDDTAKSITGALDGLLGGKKKEEPKK